VDIHRKNRWIHKKTVDIHRKIGSIHRCENEFKWLINKFFLAPSTDPQQVYINIYVFYVYIDVDIYVDNVDGDFLKVSSLKTKKFKKKICLVWITGRERNFFDFNLILKGMGCLGGL
jgi:hypothetical protein